jgi:hypothetical protein
MGEELIVDADGIPILTELVREDEIATAVEQRLGSDITAISSSKIADRLLNSKPFQKQLKEISVTLTHNVHHQVGQLLRPAIEQAIVLALEDSDTLSAETIRQQLEAALPDLLARALKK